MFNKPLIGIYALTVCLFTLGVVVVCSAFAIYNVVGVVAPGVTLAGHGHYPAEYLTNDEYLEYWRIGHKGEPIPDDAAVTRLRLASVARNMSDERDRNIAELIEKLCFIAVSAVVFAVHWRIARRHQNGQPVA